MAAAKQVRKKTTKKSTVNASKKKRAPEALRDMEQEAREERAARTRTRKKTRTPAKQRRKAKVADVGRGTEAQKMRKGRRLPPPVPEGKTLDEIRAMDPDDPEFKHPQGGKRKSDGPTEHLTWRQAARTDGQKRANGRRAKVRKHEAVVVKAIQETGIVRGSVDNPTENALIAEKVIDIEDWDREELIRGYRRNRRGRFGPPPKYIPREVQQECWKRLIKIGEKEMQTAYLDVILGLIDQARGYTFDPETGERVDIAVSDKVSLDAKKTIMERLVGKVPDHLLVGQEAPWQDMLADSLEPVGLIERTTTEIEAHRVTELEGGDDPDSGEAAPRRSRPSLPSNTGEREVLEGEIVD